MSINDRFTLGADKAYLFGLIIGGGCFGNSKDGFIINLPYCEWGNISSNPQRASEITKDILTGFSPLIYNAYKLSVVPSFSKSQWQIKMVGDYSTLESDLHALGVNLSNDMRKSANISTLCSSLNNDLLKKRFILGLADTIGSVNPNHRRFSDDVQIVSFEFSGFNYLLVFEICKLFASVGCFADQVLWNHPNMHATLDSYYTSWKKGFKLRVPLDFYTEKLGFTFRSKTMSARENLKKETKGKISSICCSKKKLSIGCSTVHPAEHDLSLPEIIRDGHYIHHKHICAVLGCPFAPYHEIDQYLKNIEYYFSPFPLIHKSLKSDIEAKIKHDSFLSKRAFTDTTYKISFFVDAAKKNNEALLFGDEVESGYPIGKILDAINYLIQKNENMLRGQRTSGNRDLFIASYVENNPEATIIVKKADLVSVLIVEMEGNEGSVMVSAKNPKVYKKLVSRSDSNKYKIVIRQITENDYE